MADEQKKKENWPSYTMVAPHMRRIYFRFYKATYQKTQIDRKTKELIAIAASLGFECEGCLQGHIEKALQYGATRDEISEAIVIAMGVAAAAVVDQTDKISEKMQIQLFGREEEEGPEAGGGNRSGS